MLAVSSNGAGEYAADTTKQAVYRVFK